MSSRRCLIWLACVCEIYDMLALTRLRPGAGAGAGAW